MTVRLMLLAAVCLPACLACAGDTNLTAGAEGFVRQVVQSLLEGEGKVTFPVAEKMFAIDNGESQSREEFQQAWRELAKQATRKKVSVEQFFRDVEVRMDSPRNNKRLTGNRRLQEAYKYQEGDLYVDASHVKEGVENFIAYDKAFVYIIRKVDDKWSLIAIGG